MLLLRVKMDIAMIPIIIRLTGRVKMLFPFVGWKVIFQQDLWRYQANTIHGNIFEYHNKKPDETPPEIMAYCTPVVSHVN